MVKAGAKGQMKKFKNFDANWSTDIKSAATWGNQNITKVKAVHSVGKMRGRSGTQKKLGKGLVKVAKVRYKSLRSYNLQFVKWPQN